MRTVAILLMTSLCILAAPSFTFSLETQKLRENAKNFKEPKQVFSQAYSFDSVNFSKNCSEEVEVDFAIEKGILERVETVDDKKTDSDDTTEGGFCENCLSRFKDTILTLSQYVLPYPIKIQPHKKLKPLEPLPKGEVHVRFAVDWLESTPELSATPLAKDIKEYKGLLSEYNEASFEWALDAYEYSRQVKCSESICEKYIPASLKNNKWHLRKQELSQKMIALHDQIEKDVGALSVEGLKKLLSEMQKRREQRIAMSESFLKFRSDLSFFYNSDNKDFHNEYPYCGASELEIQLIKSYTDDWYSSVNGFLWDTPVEKTQTERVVPLVYMLTNALRGLPPFQGVVGRGGDSLPKDIIKEHSKGNIVLNKGLTSAGRDGGWSGEKKYSFMIFSREGRAVEDLSKHHSEREILFPPFQQFEVLYSEAKKYVEGQIFSGGGNNFVMLDQGNKIGWDVVSKDWSEYLKEESKK